MKKGFSLGSVTAAIGLCALPVLNALEIDWGGGWLFGLRGERPAPEEVMVVTIDQESSRRLGLPNIPRQWPRSLHAQVVRNLTRWGARVIAFDVRFEQNRTASDDEEFASAVREAGNVVLFAYLAKQRHAASDGQTEAFSERIIAPIPALADAAAASAPFPLPKLPVKVHQYWLFKPEAGDAPTLPVVAMQVFARPEYRRALDPLLRAQLLQSDPG
ncbi:MAG: CHASE2 domain-containing protein, partial [Gammaproteobacteria bacterium]